MKRKALITSTAILLVALMCLATATYAWFTAGSADQVASLNLSISAGSTGLSIAPADAAGGTFAPQVFKTTALTTTELETYAYLPALLDGAYSLEPVSTNGVFNGGYKFYEAATEDYIASTGEWTVTDVENNEYLLFSFYVKYDGTEAKNYKATLTSDLFENGNFAGTVKIGTNVVDATYADGVVSTATPTDLTVAKPNATAETTPYKALTANTGVITNDTTNKAFAGTAATADMADTGVLADIPLNFTSATGAKLVTIAVWLEGQDYDCQGSLKIDSSAFNVALSAA